MSEVARSAISVVRTADELDACLRVLRAHAQTAAFVVDCEGVELGKSDASLCLLQIKPVGVKQIFIVDVVALGRSAFTQTVRMSRRKAWSLASLLESESTRKVFFDARMDMRALYREHGVRVRNVHDAQVVNIALSEFSARPMRRTPGLMTTLRYFNGAEAARIELLKARVTDAFDANPSAWRSRPLSADFIAYAANDCVAIETLFAALAARVTRRFKSAPAHVISAFYARADAESTRRAETLYADDADLSPEAMTRWRSAPPRREECGVEGAESM